MKNDVLGIRKVKGIDKHVFKKIKHEEYQDVFSGEKYVRHDMKGIQSKNHKLGTYKINKIISLSYFDDKKYMELNIIKCS